MPKLKVQLAIASNGDINLFTNKGKPIYMDKKSQANISKSINESVIRNINTNKEVKNVVNKEASKIVTKKVSDYVHENTRSVKIIENRVTEENKKSKKRVTKDVVKFRINQDKIVDLYKYAALYFVRLVINTPLDDKYTFTTKYKTVGYDKNKKRYVTVIDEETGEKKRTPKKSEIKEYTYTHKPDKEITREKWIITIGGKSYGVKDIQGENIPDKWYLENKMDEPLIDAVAALFMKNNSKKELIKKNSKSKRKRVVVKAIRTVKVFNTEDEKKLFVLEEGGYETIKPNGNTEIKVGKNRQRGHGLKHYYSVQAPKGIIKLTNVEFDALTLIDNTNAGLLSKRDPLRKFLKNKTTSELMSEFLSTFETENENGYKEKKTMLYVGRFNNYINLKLNDNKELFKPHSKSYDIEVKFQEEDKKFKQKMSKLGVNVSNTRWQGQKKTLERYRKKALDGGLTEEEFETIVYNIFSHTQDSKKGDKSGRPNYTRIDTILNEKVFNQINVKKSEAFYEGKELNGVNYISDDPNADKVEINNEVNGTSVTKTVATTVETIPIKFKGKDIEIAAPKKGYSISNLNRAETLDDLIAKDEDGNKLFYDEFANDWVFLE